jgi:hypothetical protein
MLRSILLMCAPGTIDVRLEKDKRCDSATGRHRVAPLVVNPPKRL